jgi:hypothetical protein
MIMICLFWDIIVISIIIAIEIRFPLGEGTLSKREIAFHFREGYRSKPPRQGVDPFELYVYLLFSY